MFTRFHLNGGDSPLTEEQVRFICAEIGCALDYLRTKNVIHRDVKPENILLDDWGHAHLTDFNVATKLDSGTSNDALFDALSTFQAFAFLGGPLFLVFIFGTISVSDIIK